MTKTNISVPPELVELIFNPEARAAEADFIAVARKLIDGGMPVRTVGRGLAGALATLIVEEYPKGDAEFIWAKQFLRELEGGFGHWRDHLDLIDEVADDIERSRAVGGNGKFQ